MSKLSTIDINNFRGIKETSEPIPLDNLTVIIGRNGTGKSSFLEALYTFVGGQDPIDNSYRARSIVDDKSRNSLAHHYTGTSEICAEIGNYEVKTRLEDRVMEVSIDGDDYGNELPLGKFSTGNSDPDRNQWNLFFTPERDYEDQLTSLSRYTNEITKLGIHEKVANFLSDSTNLNLTEVYLEHNEIRVHPEDQSPFLLPLEDLAHGLLKTAPAYVAGEYFNPNYIIWDDIEAALHPKLLDQIFGWLADMDSQVIVATHSMDALLATLNVESDDVSVLQLEATDDRILHFESLAKEELRSYIDKAGHDPRFFPVETE